jgi:hypothetical protein
VSRLLAHNLCFSATTAWRDGVGRDAVYHFKSETFCGSAKMLDEQAVRELVRIADQSALEQECDPESPPPNLPTPSPTPPSSPITLSATDPFAELDGPTPAAAAAAAAVAAVASVATEVGAACSEDPTGSSVAAAAPRTGGGAGRGRGGGGERGSPNKVTAVTAAKPRENVRSPTHPAIKTRFPTLSRKKQTAENSSRDGSAAVKPEQKMHKANCAGAGAGAEAGAGDGAGAGAAASASAGADGRGFAIRKGKWEPSSGGPRNDDRYDTSHIYDCENNMWTWDDAFQEVGSVSPCVSLCVSLRHPDPKSQPSSLREALQLLARITSQYHRYSQLPSTTC